MAQRETVQKFGIRSVRRDLWKKTVATLARLRGDEVGYPLLHNLAISLFALDVGFEPVRLVAYWKEVSRALGRVPVMVRRDVPGFVGNRLQFALLREAVHIVEAGIAEPGDVDLAMRAGLGLRYAALGPLETTDFAGLDVFGAVMDYLLPALDAARERPGL